MSASQLCGNRQPVQSTPSQALRRALAAAAPPALDEPPPNRPLEAVEVRPHMGIADAVLHLAFPDLRPAALQHIFGRIGG